jgi:hypothetical protein
MAFKSPAEVIDQAMAEEALTIAREIVTKRVHEEENIPWKPCSDAARPRRGSRATSRGAVGIEAKPL